MKAPSIPANEKSRLEALKSYDILDTPPEDEYDEIVRLAALICGTTISTVTLIDEKRQWFKARLGLDAQEGHRDISFCAHAVGNSKPLIVPDTMEDARFVDNPYVTGAPDIRFYAGVPLITDEGHALGTLCVIDPTPRQLTAEQLEALTILSNQVVKQMNLRKRLVSFARSHEANTRLLSVISHDIQSPLKSLRGLITLVEEYGLSAEEFKSHLPEVKAKINSVSELLSQLLEWSSSQLDRNLSRTKVMLRNAVDETIKLNYSAFSQKNNQVINKVDASLAVLGDEHMVAFLLRNLLLNANKFSQSSSIEVSALPKRNMVEICVRDHGVGIPPERISTLFSWDHRQSTKGTTGEKGSGFALLISKEFVEKSGGEMRVESEPGKGTSFYFTLPIA